LSQSDNGFDPFDPTGMMKSMRDASMDAWSKMMIQLVNTDAYAKATGALLDAWLGSSMPFRKAMETALTQTLTSLQLPTRTDITNLAQRLTQIEMRLDDLEANLAQTQHAGPKPARRKTGSSGEPQT
jgi:hypothetical protein